MPTSASPRPDASGSEAAEPLIDRASVDTDSSSDVVNCPGSSNAVSINSKHQSHDLFQPFDDLLDEPPGNILTLRAIVVGLFCGLLIGASNVYLGLKAGWTSSANIFGSIIGFALLKPCARLFPRNAFLNGEFGVGENNIVQTVATAAGGMSSVYTSAMPALYQLGLLSSNPSQDFGRLTTLTMVGALFGLFFATPLRSLFIVRLARELSLIFPTPTATASAIRSLHLATGGTPTAKAQLRGLTTAFTFAAVFKTISEYAVGLLWDWHVFTWLTAILGPVELLTQAESWGWFVEWTPAFIGLGILVSNNVTFSFLFGTFLAWGFLGPIITSVGLAHGRAVPTDISESTLMTYFSLTQEDASADHPSPRYWLLWPGVLAMMGVSLTEILCQWRTFYLGAKTLWKATSASLMRRQLKKKESYELNEYDSSGTNIATRAFPEELIPAWFWMSGIAVTVVLCVLVMKLQFDMPVLETLLALFLSFFFSLLAVQTCGATDVTPLTAASKASQVILGSVTSSQGWALQDAQRLNLLGGALSSIGAGQAADLVGDFRVGYLLGTSPRVQWRAQAIGTFFACLFTPAVYVIFSNAYGCINDAQAQTCAFQTPSASAWRVVAIAVTDPTFPIPPSALKFALAFTAVACSVTWARRNLLVGKRAWMQSYCPDFMIVGLSLVIPAAHYAIAMVIGWSLKSLWMRRNRAGFEVKGSSVAAGLIAGEGIGGLVVALLAIAGLSGPVWGTTIGCPAGRC